MTEELIVVERQAHVATVRLNRPQKLNAVTQDMSDQLVRIVRELNDDAETRAVVYTGTGRAFSAGSDISTLDHYETPWEFRNRPPSCRPGIPRLCISSFTNAAMESSLLSGWRLTEGCA